MYMYVYIWQVSIIRISHTEWTLFCRESLEKAEEESVENAGKTGSKSDILEPLFVKQLKQVRIYIYICMCVCVCMYIYICI